MLGGYNRVGPESRRGDPAPDSCASRAYGFVVQYPCVGWAAALFTSGAGRLVKQLIARLKKAAQPPVGTAARTCAPEPPVRGLAAWCRMTRCLVSVAHLRSFDAGAPWQGLPRSVLPGGDRLRGSASLNVNLTPSM